VTPTGVTNVNYGGSQTYNITPNGGYNVATLTVDGSLVTPNTTYTFTNVTASHTISATFSHIIAYRGGGGIAQYATNPLAVTTSVAAQLGDLIILVATADNASATFTWPTGFVQNAADTACTVDGQRMRFATKIAGSSEPLSYSVSHSSGNTSAVAVVIYSGVDNVTPLDVLPTARVVNTSTQTPWSITGTGLSSGTANRLLVGIAGVDDLVVAQITTTVPTPTPSPWSLRVDTPTTSVFANLGIFDAVDSMGSFTSNVISTQTSGTSGIFGGTLSFLLALRPLP
jgi:hypothetical protein